MSSSKGSSAAFVDAFSSPSRSSYEERLRRDETLRHFRLDLAPEDADEHWNRIVTRHAQLIRGIGAPLDIRATAFDYFLRRGVITEPVVVEQESLEETELLAYRDRLTGLHNYAYFDAEIRLEVARALRYETSLALVLVDVDGFKRINDRLGHGTGNDALVHVARLLKKGMRDGDVIARVGGDEFALLLHRADLSIGTLVAVRKREAIEQWFGAPPHAGSELAVTASLGVAALPAQARSVRELFEAADAALYHAKRSGRNRIGFARGDRLVCLQGPSVAGRFPSGQARIWSDRDAARDPGPRVVHPEKVGLSMTPETSPRL